MKNKITAIACTVVLMLCQTTVSAGKSAPDNPQKTIVQVLDKLEMLSSTTDTTNSNQFPGYIHNEILSNFALKEMSQWISGPQYKYMTQTERQDFRHKIENSLSRVISNNINTFRKLKSKVKFVSTQYKTNKEAIVETRIKLYNYIPIKLDLHMLRIGSNWKIIDIKANGASALIHYRQYFMPQLRLYAHKTK